MFEKLLHWSEKEFSHLPWRKGRTLYRTLVSEIMLQQTTVPTVVNHFERFLKRYPDVFSLANSSEEEVCIEWKGLGYYRRARALLAACQEIVQKYQGEIPMDFGKLQKIQGIGPYTASALLAIGGNRKALPVDANLERVLARLFAIEGVKGPSLQKKISQEFEAGKILTDWEDWGPRALSEAMMDLGRTFCRAGKAECGTCPVNRDCRAYKEGKVDAFPQVAQASLTATAAEKKLHTLSLLRVVVRQGKRKPEILAYQKKAGEWLQGQWELPTFILETSDESLKQYPRLSEKKIKVMEFSKIKKFRSTITKYKIDNLVFEISLNEFQKLFSDLPYKVEFRPLDLSKENFATGLMKALASLN